MSLTSSTIPFVLSACKSIIFRTSSLLLQYTVCKLFAFIAFRNDAFTSYLMFNEAPYQKLLYILSRGFRRQSFLLLAFAVFFAVAALWDTMLWGLDSPGWIVQPSHVTAGAQALMVKMRSDPAYSILSQTYNGVDALDLERDLGDGIWDGINATLVGAVDIGTPRTSKIMNYSKSYFPSGPGPRIWLDDEGWSVNVDALLTTTSTFSCPMTSQGSDSATWGCFYTFYDGLNTGLNFLSSIFGSPGFWWEAGGGYLDMDVLETERGLNPWNVLGTGADSMIMKEVFTLTKGTTRHVFLLTAWKTTMLAFLDAPISMPDIEELVSRTWQEGRSKSEQVEVLSGISSAIKLDKGFNTGKQTVEGNHEVHSRIYQYLKAMDVPNNSTVYSAFQILDSNVTLIRTDTVPPPVPFGTCNTGYRNDATGGMVRRSTCLIYDLDGGPDGNFLGQADASAVLVLQDILGQRRAQTSATALNESAWRWFQDKNNEIDASVLSRGYIFGVSPDAVQVDIDNYVPAVSILQLILVAVSVAVAVAAYILLNRGASPHYQTSLFSSLAATTHTGYNSEKPGYMKNPPEISIVKRDDRVYLGTQGGAVLYMGGEASRGLEHNPETMMYGVDGASGYTTGSSVVCPEKGVMSQS